jgi:ABC-type arginine transport system permease subunit
MPSTIRLHRVLRAVPERVYRAFLQDGVPDIIPAEACYFGWQESLALLTELVEAEIPDGP